VDAAPDSPPQRGGRIFAEVEAVAAVDPFEQERELDLVDVVPRSLLLDP
jgi:hypothetical protein